MRPSAHRKLPLSQKVQRIAIVALWLAAASASLWGSESPSACPRPQVGSAVPEPGDLRSQNGVLEAELRISNVAAPNGSTLYCYTDAAGDESPNLRVNPGDLVILHLRNTLTDLSHSPLPVGHTHAVGDRQLDAE